MRATSLGLLGGAIALICRLVAEIGAHVPLPAENVSLGPGVIAPCPGPIAPVGNLVAFVRGAVTLVCDQVALVTGIVA